MTTARGRTRLVKIPVIFMSALPLLVTATSLASFFLAKSFTADRLVDAVQRSLGNWPQE
ncbi:response regulator [Azospirillum agricola]|uniref:hypothetical protein n=1 Tax=Azospirillum agricola TaxID=1720247 RepID=UPI0015C4D243|nr:hypothetical protein [Azospirillum agricola]